MGKPAFKAHKADYAPLWPFAKEQVVDDVWTADLNGDGLDDVVIGFNGGTGLHVLDNSGNVLWTNVTIGNVWHVMAGNVDGDVRPVFVTATANGKVTFLELRESRYLSPKPLLVIALADRSVYVVDVLTGQENGQTPGQGAAQRRPGSPLRDGTPLSLWLQGARFLRAYKIADK